MPAHVIYGDSFLVAQEVRRVREASGAADLMDSNHQRFAASQAPLAEVMAACQSMPFLDSMRLVEVEGALAAHEPRGRGGGGQTRAGGRRSGSAPGWMQLVEAIPQMPDTTLLVLIDGEVTDRNPLLKPLGEHSELRRLAAPTGQGLNQWVKRAVEGRGASIVPPAITAIIELVGNDLWTLDRELEKLSLYAAGREIRETDVTRLVSYAQEANIFGAVDAIVEGRPGEALRLLALLMDEGREPLQIMAMIVRQLRLIALARDLTERGVVQPELGQRMGTRSDFVVRKTVAQARYLSLPDIAWKYRRTLDCDLAIKQGRLDPETALELLVADLAGA